MKLFDQVIDGLGTALRFQEQRQRLINENVANAETPGYRGRRLEFQGALERAFGRDGDDDEPLVTPERDAVVKIDGNSVDLEREMAELADNSFRIQTMSRLLARKYQSLRRAIEEGGRR